MLPIVRPLLPEAITGEFSEMFKSPNSTIVREAGRKVPPFPSIFFKPSTTVTDHGVNVVIPKIAQDDQADYEGELVCYLASM
jgi:hypothetical protein